MASTSAAAANSVTGSTDVLVGKSVGGLPFVLAEAQRLGLRRPTNPSAAAPGPHALDDVTRPLAVTGTTASAASSATALATSSSGSSSGSSSASASAAASVAGAAYRSAHTVALWRRAQQLRARADALDVRCHALHEHARCLAVTDTAALHARTHDRLRVLADHTELLTAPTTVAAILKRVLAYQPVPTTAAGAAAARAALTPAIAAAAAAGQSSQSSQSQPQPQPHEMVVVHQNVQPVFLDLLQTMATEVHAADAYCAALRWCKPNLATHHKALETAASEVAKYERLYQLYGATLQTLRGTMYAVAHDAPLPVPAVAAVDADEEKRPDSAASVSTSSLRTPARHAAAGPRASPQRRWR